MKNFEKYKTAKTRTIAFMEWCGAHVHAVGCDRCPAYSKDFKIKCVLAWLELEYEEEKPLPCPFCGSGCAVDVNFERRWLVGCSNNECLYLLPSFDYKSEAIAAHNRVARAVAECKEKVKGE